MKIQIIQILKTMDVLLYLIFVLLGWNPLLCSSLTSYWYFFAVYFFNAVMLAIIIKMNSFLDHKYDDRNWLNIPFACYVAWALAGDHICALFSLSFNTQFCITCLIIMIDIVLYFAIKENNKALEFYGEYARLREDYKKLSDRVEKRWGIICSCDRILRNNVDSLTDDLKALEINFRKLDGGLIDTMIDNIELNERRYRLLMKPLNKVPFFIDNPRIFNALRNHEVLSMFDLCQWDKSSLCRLHGIGKNSVEKINEYLMNQDLCLGLDVFRIVKRHEFFACYSKKP